MTEKRKHKMRGIVNAILYVTKTGCQWRMLPKDYERQSELSVAFMHPAMIRVMLNEF